ncbi:MAG: nuclear transport factor 2 family protein [Flavipsychrobacter sp.]
MKTNLETIKELYQNFSAKNTEAIRELFADDISWKQMEGFPNGGHYIGADAIFKNVFAGFGENWTGWSASIDEFVATGDDVFAIGKYSGTYNKTQKSMEAAFIHRYRLSDGKVKQFVQYTDTQLVANAMN